LACQPLVAQEIRETENKKKKNKKEKKRHYKVYSNLTVERTGHDNEVVEIKNDTGYLKTLQDKQFGL
jgi:hypothetical protein